MNTLTEERRARLKSLSERYYGETLNRLDIIRDSRDSLAKGDPEAFKSLILNSHSLAGSGASMGYPELSDAASVLDEALRSFVGEMETARTIPPDLMSALEHYFPPLEKVIALMTKEEAVERLWRSMSQKG